METIKDLYDLKHTLAAEYLAGFTYPWEALSGIKGLILTLGPALGEDYTEVSAGVWVHKTAKIAPTAYLGAPCIIGAGTEVRHCAFVRGAALVGKGSEVIQNIDMVGSNLDMGQGMCGSSSGSVPTNVGQPLIRVSTITVGGR